MCGQWTIETIISIPIFFFHLVHLGKDLHQSSKLLWLKLVVVPVHNHLDDVLVRAENIHYDDHHCQHLVMHEDEDGMEPLTDDPVNDFGGGDGPSRIETNDHSPPAELAQEDVYVQAPLPVEQVHFRHLLLLLLPVGAALPLSVTGGLGGLGSDQTEQVLHVSEVWGSADFVIML